jgi:hypothetical protein
VSAETQAPVVTGESAAPAVEPVDHATTAPPRADKPMLVYVVPDEASGSDYDKVEKVLLTDEKVALGTRAFRRVKVAQSDAAKDAILSKSGTAAPRFVVISADYKTVTTVEKSKLTIPALWSSMTDAATKFYASSIDDAVKQTRDVLVEYDKIAGEKKVLEDKKTRLDTKPNPTELKEVEAKLAAIDERQAKAAEREQKIWDLKPKA